MMCRDPIRFVEESNRTVFKRRVNDRSKNVSSAHVARGVEEWNEESIGGWQNARHSRRRRKKRKSWRTCKPWSEIPRGPKPAAPLDFDLITFRYKSCVSLPSSWAEHAMEGTVRRNTDDWRAISANRWRTEASTGSANFTGRIEARKDNNAVSG